MRTIEPRVGIYWKENGIKRDYSRASTFSGKLRRYTNQMMIVTVSIRGGLLYVATCANPGKPPSVLDVRIAIS